jgi:hypothetical protein
MRREYFIAWVGLVCLLGSVPVWAEDAKTSVPVSAASAVPRLVRYSGVVKEVAGKPLQGAVEVSFSLYEDQEGGSAIWSERQAVEADALGRYAVLLGATQAEGLPAEIFASGKARWLEVEVQGLSPQPRVLLVSVPYAMKAEDAERLGGRKATDFVLAEQLKEEVKTAVSLQVVPVEKWVATKEAALTAPTSGAPAITSGQSSFACSTTTPCVTVSQTSTGIGIQSAAKTLGLYGLATQTTGTTYGIQGRSVSTTGRGVFGYATAATGATQGVYGLALSTTGIGLFGDATATTGATRGLYARAASTSGVGVWGDATAPSGATRGVIGRTYSPSGIGAWGYATNTSGSTTGVRGDVWSPNGIAGIFNTVNPSGKILVGRVNNSDKFSVTGSGDVVASGAGTFSNGVEGTGYWGVSGISAFGVGVHGQSTNYWGVAGESGYGGVYGGGNTYGVFGASSDTGVYGYSDTTWGTGVSGWGATGVWGTSADGNGVAGEGYLHGVRGTGYYVGVSGSGTETGVYGYGETLAGVYGESAGYGVHGYSSGSYALYAEGDIGYTGSIVQVVPLASNRVVSLNAMQSPENWFEDFGSGQLQDGAAEITLDPTFAETVNTESGYHVFLTPNGDSQGLYIARKSPAGFEVREQRGGKSDIAFDYRIVARRRGYETVRLRQVEADAEVVTKLRERMAAASSAKLPKLVLHKEMEKARRPEPPKRATRPARPARMTFPQLLNAPGLMNAPQGLNLGAPSNY